jgi:hypothetical protein
MMKNSRPRTVKTKSPKDSLIPKVAINPTDDLETYYRMGGIYVIPEQVQPETLEK